MIKARDTAEVFLFSIISLSIITTLTLSGNQLSCVEMANNGLSEKWEFHKMQSVQKIALGSMKSNSRIRPQNTVIWSYILPISSDTTNLGAAIRPIETPGQDSPMTGFACCPQTASFTLKCPGLDNRWAPYSEIISIGLATKKQAVCWELAVCCCVPMLWAPLRLFSVLWQA